jgi:hypothetical protein
MPWALPISGFHKGDRWGLAFLPTIDEIGVSSFRDIHTDMPGKCHVTGAAPENGAAGILTTLHMTVAAPGSGIFIFNRGGCSLTPTGIAENKNGILISGGSAAGSRARPVSGRRRLTNLLRWQGLPGLRTPLHTARAGSGRHRLRRERS